MNIYDEALKETQDFGAFVGLKLEKTIKALERAKKVEELLGLYIKLNETPTTSKFLRKQIVGEILVIEEELK